MSRPCALCQRNVTTVYPDLNHIGFLHDRFAASSELVDIEQQQDLKLLRDLMSSTVGRHLAGSLAMEMNGIKELLRRAREIRGLKGVLSTVRVLRLAIEVRHVVSVTI